MKLRMASPPSPPFAVLCCAFIFSLLVSVALAQNRTTNATTDPYEARSLNSIFQQWGIPEPTGWNISGELCSGTAIDATTIDNPNINPGIKKVYAMDITGAIPEELWNLTYLTNMFFDSSGVSGGIPSTFANLQSLTTVWASDNELTGSIPAFIGNWSKLTTLRFQGNSFEGPIPQTLSNLTSLTDLRISDLSNRSSSLEFLNDMKLLNDSEKSQSFWLYSNQYWRISKFVTTGFELQQLDWTDSRLTVQLEFTGLLVSWKQYVKWYPASGKECLSRQYRQRYRIFPARRLFLKEPKRQVKKLGTMPFAASKLYKNQFR
ncbi:hypothetical protein RJ640_005038 [Escallonia rubra]|uniref:Uncharacterized protein n=1 Tax=Escallonia rubra TaxID=112253 RepID=A0AA88QLA4_9ASTE|nr:hypothetical protein RJ640_005038 [Escallonia rubra]